MSANDIFQRQLFTKLFKSVFTKETGYSTFWIKIVTCCVLIRVWPREISQNTEIGNLARSFNTVQLRNDGEEDLLYKNLNTHQEMIKLLVLNVLIRSERFIGSFFFGSAVLYSIGTKCMACVCFPTANASVVYTVFCPTSCTLQTFGVFRVES